MPEPHDPLAAPAPAELEGDPLKLQRERVEERLRDARGHFCPANRPAVVKAYRDRAGAARGKIPRWRELGPRPLEQHLGIDTVVSGRAAGVAISPSAPERVYLASANGGVWRSDDRGRRWIPTMDLFDLNPRTVQTDTLACGAIAVAHDDPDRVYVGTGEAATGRLLGVGPLISRVGGVSPSKEAPAWEREEVDPDAPLEGAGFFRLAVSPEDRELVLGATTTGLYRREWDGARAAWYRILEGEFTGVVVGRRSGVLTFIAAGPSHGVLAAEVSSIGDPAAWQPLGGRFPTADLGRITLAIRGFDAETVFALAATSSNSFHGVHRLDPSDQEWRRLSGAPQGLFGDDSGRWDQAIAIDPTNPSQFFIGGSTISVDSTHLGALYRCRLGADGETMSFTFVGYGVHADIQSLTFEPGKERRLWACCDGGVFVAKDPDADGLVFESCNEGLGTVTLNHIGQHPVTDELLCGTQDNGLVHYRGNGDQRWRTAFPSDSGGAVVHWAEPDRVLATIFEERLVILRLSEETAVQIEVPVDEEEKGYLEFYPPLANTPVPETIEPWTAHQADRVAFGGLRPWISENFGDPQKPWTPIPFNDLEHDRLGSAIRSLVFTSYSKLYAGTELGAVYRYDFDPATGQWARLLLAGPLSPVWFQGPVTDIVADPADPSVGSIYITLGGPLLLEGQPDFRRLWHFDGARWKDRSGPADNPRKQLLPVQHNAVAVDPKNPRQIWVGADIGVWHSKNRGETWTAFQNGLPDAAVIDLQLHPKLRLLRASTHGRGCFEIDLDA